jgi:hypothetical protein
MKFHSIFIIWFIVLSIPLTYMMGTHSLSLKSSRSTAIKQLVDAKKGANKWSELHFLGGDCACSENVYQSLVKRLPKPEINEQVFIIGKNELWKEGLSKQGYQIQMGSMDEFEKKYSIKAVPQLTILDQDKNLLYSGGYTTKRGPASIVEDEVIVRELKDKKKADERPIFGCLNGSVNRKNADPMGIKY